MQNVPECMQNVPECMQIHELACNYISLDAVTQACTQLHKLTCSYMSLHAVPSACMQFLFSSEQLTRISQCLLNYHSYEQNVPNALNSPAFCCSLLFKVLENLDLITTFLDRAYLRIKFTYLMTITLKCAGV